MNKEQIALEKINEWVGKIGSWNTKEVEVLGREEEYVDWEDYFEELMNILKEAGYKKTWNDYYEEEKKKEGRKYGLL